MSYVEDTSDVEFCPETRNEAALGEVVLPTAALPTTTRDELAHTSELHEELQDAGSEYASVPYQTPYEIFERTASRSDMYGQVVDKSADTMANVYGSAEATSGGVQSVYDEPCDDKPTNTGEESDGGTDSEEEEEEDEESEDEDERMSHRPVVRTKNWNEEFQRLLGLEPSADKFARLARLAHDFVFAAETYGKIIISELGLPINKKTIKPIAVGGQAGGEKYMVQDIFFKFASDIFGIYGGDEYAMKAASHDLKGLIHYYSCQITGLHVPLMALIDYLGFRLIAITILPINSSTLRYGSSDAGVTIHCEDPQLNAMMKSAARKMNLRGHYVGTPEGLGKKIYGPVDIEGHKGTDNRYYVVDFARTFPPERPDPANLGRKGIILYNLLRPELVKSNTVPLSSDAYTVWARADGRKDLFNLHVTQATERLFKDVIPEVARKLNEAQDRAEQGKTHVDLIEVLHSNGVNVRHLGHIRQLCNPHLQQTILIEMVARVVRKQIAEKFRKKTRKAGLPTEEPQKVAAVKHLNMLLGRHRNSAHYWRSLKRALTKKFAKSLLEHELQAGYDLRRSLGITTFFNRLRTLAPNIIPLTEEATKDFARAIRDSGEKTWGEWVPNFKFLPSDMTTLHATVKHMNLIDIAEASAMFYKALEEKGYDQTRLLVQGLGKFQIASRKMPFLDVNTVILLGDMLVAQATNLAKPHSEEETLLLSNALIAYQTALNLEPANTSCVIGVGNIHARRRKWSEAIASYEAALAIDPRLAPAYLLLARAHSTCAGSSPAEGTVRLIESHLLRALEIDPNYYEALVMLGELLFSDLHQVLRGASEVNEESLKKLHKVGQYYEMALALRADDLEAYIFVDRILEHVAHSGPMTSRWFDYALPLLWHVAEASPAFKRLLISKLAKLPEVHLRHCRDILTDETFRATLWAARSTNTLVLRENKTVTEAALLEWLKQHPQPLRELKLEGCPQFTTALLRGLAQLPHRMSLETLCLEALPLAKADLIDCFAAGAEPEPESEPKSESKSESEAEAEPESVAAAEAQPKPWSRLTTLQLSKVAEVDDEVVSVLARLPALTTLEYGDCPAVTSATLARLPARLARLRLGGGVSLGDLTSLAQRCAAGLTHLSLVGVTGLAPQEFFSVTPHLPSLQRYQLPTGNVHLYSGRSNFDVTFVNRGNISFTLPHGPTLYEIKKGFQLVMQGEDLTLTISNDPSLKLISDKGTSLVRAHFAPLVGWNATTMMPGLKTAALVQFQHRTNHFMLNPPLAVIHYKPQQGQASISVRPGNNVTVLLAVLYLGFTIQ